MEAVAEHIKVPELRFPEFSGEWEEKRLRSISSLITKGTTPNGFDSNGDVTFVKTEAIYGTAIQKRKCLKISSEVHHNALKRSKLVDGDLLFAIAGSIGKVALVSPTLLPANTNQALAIIRTSETNRPFLLQNLQSSRLSRYTQKCVSVGAQPNLSLKQLGDYILGIPNSEEMSKIAEFLTAVDEKIGKLKRKKVLLEAYKKGAMQKLFSQEIRFKDDQGNPYPDWEEKRLRSISSLITKGTTPNGFDSNGDVTFVKTEAIYGTAIQKRKCLKISSEVHHNALKRSKLVDGDLLFAIAGSIGKVALVSPTLLPANTNQALAIIRTSETNRPFLLQNLQSSRLSRYTQKCVSVGAQPNLSLKQLGDYILGIPNSEEMSKIAEFLTGIDDKIKAVANQIDKAAEFKKGLLQKMFV